MPKRNRPRSRKQLIIDFALYILIGIAVCVAAFLAAVYTKIDSRTFRWIGLAGITPVTFGYPLHDLPRRLRSRKIWTTWSALLVLHSILYTLLLSSVSEWPLFNFAIINAVETVGISMLLDRVVALDRTKTRRAALPDGAQNRRSQ